MSTGKTKFIPKSQGKCLIWFTKESVYRKEEEDGPPKINDYCTIHTLKDDGLIYISQYNYCFIYEQLTPSHNQTGVE